MKKMIIFVKLKRIMQVGTERVLKEYNLITYVN